MFPKGRERELGPGPLPPSKLIALINLKRIVIDVCSRWQGTPAVNPNPRLPPMSQKSAEHHAKAAEHHEHAARHHKEAAKHYAAGSHEKAAHHAHVARGHDLHADQHAEEAAKHHVEEHGSK